MSRNWNLKIGNTVKSVWNVEASEVARHQRNYVIRILYRYWPANVQQKYHEQHKKQI